jgi:hypothetical protein
MPSEGLLLLAWLAPGLSLWYNMEATDSCIQDVAVNGWVHWTVQPQHVCPGTQGGSVLFKALRILCCMQCTSVPMKFYIKKACHLCVNACLCVISLSYKVSVDDVVYHHVHQEAPPGTFELFGCLVLFLHLIIKFSPTYIDQGNIAAQGEHGKLSRACIFYIRVVKGSAVFLVSRAMRRSMGTALPLYGYAVFWWH